MMCQEHEITGSFYDFDATLLFVLNDLSFNPSRSGNA